ncbi:hypothetical protein [Streptomyces sp. LBL]|uniref:hypothetical protein n=1 Tax=Streptomyces sp. LBL TaxID=2940562 RepID=UPI002474DF53|nr:hypothetical protein [Streptomyces sp. LBL]
MRRAGVDAAPVVQMCPLLDGRLAPFHGGGHETQGQTLEVGEVVSVESDLPRRLCPLLSDQAPARPSVFADDPPEHLGVDVFVVASHVDLSPAQEAAGEPGVVLP